MGEDQKTGLLLRVLQALEQEPVSLRLLEASEVGELLGSGLKG